MLTRLGYTTTCPTKPWTERQTISRTRRICVEFTTPFDKTPVVNYSLTRLDMNERYGTRYDINLVAVNPSAFVLQFGIWCNTYCTSATVTFWVAGVTGESTSENGAHALSYVVTELSPGDSIFK